MANTARIGNSWVVVVDGNERRAYNGNVRGGEIVFDSADRFHYLVAKGNVLTLVEEQLIQ